MKTLLKLTLASLAATLTFSAHAENPLNSYASMRINSTASSVWDVVKDFDGLENWLPVFSAADIKSGTNNEVGAVRTLTIKDGPSFDEVLIAWDADERTYTYQVIDPAPLPVKNYESTLTVMQLEPGVVDITWISSYQNNSNGEMSDDEVIAFINGVYTTGLEQVKAMTAY